MTAPGGGAVVTVGSFDGVHRGHHVVLADVARRARAQRLASLLVTFEPHPLEVVNPAAAPRLLTTLEEKRELLAQLDLDRLAVLPFTPNLARLEPEAFVVEVLLGRFGMRELVLGYDHGFGRGRAGDVELAQRLGRERGFAVDVVEPVNADGQPISSTLIRTALAHGNLEAAARWLGRPYTVRAMVGRGAGRGRAHGVPTINLLPPARKLLPPDGVYAVWLSCRGARHGGMMNQGPRPTFGVVERALEIHLFDFADEVYGESVQVQWVRRLRDVQAFDSRDALVAQLERDRRAARDSLNLASVR